MNQYIVTIAREDQPGTSPDDPLQLVVRVTTDGDAASVGELTIRGAEGSRLDPRELPMVDLQLLARALAAGTPASSASSATPEADAVATTRPEPAKPQKPAGGRRTTAVRRSRATARTAASARTSPAAANGERAYRRMPDTAELQRAYAQVGTITGLAQHFGVPRHTAQGWMSRLRKKGMSP